MTTKDQYKTTELQYIYLIRPREFLRLNESTYKIGKTTQHPNNRLGTYPLGSEICVVFSVTDCHEMEKRLIRRFKQLFIHRKDYGAEYFTGSVYHMKMVILQEIMAYEMDQHLNNIDCPMEPNDEEQNDYPDSDEQSELIPLSSPQIEPKDDTSDSEMIDDLPAPKMHELKHVQKNTRFPTVQTKTPITFCKFVYDTKPNWYKEDAQVLMSLILEEYQKYSGDYEATDSALSRKLNGRMFTRSTRTIGIGTFKKLYSYADLKRNAGF